MVILGVLALLDMSSGTETCWQPVLGSNSLCASAAKKDIAFLTLKHGIDFRRFPRALASMWLRAMTWLTCISNRCLAVSCGLFLWVLCQLWTVLVVLLVFLLVWLVWSFLVFLYLFVPGCCDEADLSCFVGSATVTSLLQISCVSWVLPVIGHQCSARVLLALVKKLGDDASRCKRRCFLTHFFAFGVGSWFCEGSASSL